MNYSYQRNRTEQNGPDRYLFSSTECVAWLAVFMTEAVAIVTLNILTIIVFMKNRSLRKRSMYLVINLAVADVFVGGFSNVTASVLLLGEMCSFWQYFSSLSGIWISVIMSMNLLFLLTSLTNLAAISLERLHATFFPFKHRVIGKWTFGVIITVVWVTAALFIVVVIATVFPAVIATICLLVIFVSYASIAVKIHCGAHPQHHGAASRERKLTKTLFIMTWVSLLMCLPYAIIIFLSLESEVFLNFATLVQFRMSFSLVLLYYANSLVNPILYAFRMPEFKRALVSLFRRSAQPQGQVQVFPLRAM